jgi:two-component system LytT family response regulator
MEKSTFLATFESRNYGISYSLEKLEDLLDPSLFFRISRQHIINFHSIEKIQLLSKSRIAIKHSLKDIEPLLVSTARTAQFREWLER